MPIKITDKQYEKEIERLVEMMRSEATAAPDDSEQAKRERRERARTDRVWGLQYYLPHYFDQPLGKFHRELLALFGIKGNLTAIAAPRGFGKSTVAHGDDVLDILFGEVKFLIIGSRTEELASGHTIPIRLELEENPRIRQDFGDTKTSTWSDKVFIVNNRTYKTRTKVWARGIGQTVRGQKYQQRRPDKIRLDDMEDNESSRSPEQCQKTLEWLNSDVIPAGGKSGLECRINWLGTMIRKRCALGLLFADVDSEYSEWVKKKYKAIQDDNTSLWPEVYSVDDILKIKARMGSRSFYAEMQEEPWDDEGTFRPGWIRWFSEREIFIGDLTIVAGIDLSHKETGGCYKSLIDIGQSRDGSHIYVLRSLIEHLSDQEIIEAMYNHYDKFHHKRMRLDATAGQSRIGTEINRKAKEKGYYLPIEYWEATANKILRIQGLSSLVELGIIMFNQDDPGSKKLVEQLLNFPSGKIDGPDALEMAVGVLEKATQPFKYTTVERRRCAGLRKAGAL